MLMNPMVERKQSPETSPSIMVGSLVFSFATPTKTFELQLLRIRQAVLHKRPRLNAQFCLRRRKKVRDLRATQCVQNDTKRIGGHSPDAQPIDSAVALILLRWWWTFQGLLSS